MWISQSELGETSAMRQPFGGVVFDLDDVLYPGRQYTLGGCRAVADYLFTTYGVRLYEAMVARSETGDGLSAMEQTVRECFTGQIDAALMRCRHVFWTHAPRLTLFPDAALALAYLRARRVRLAVVSRNQPHVHAAKAAALRLDVLLDCVLCAGSPDYADSIAGSLMLAELALDVPLTRMVYVGATEQSDFRAAIQTGMVTAQVNRTESAIVSALAPDPSPHILLPTLAALPGALLDYAAQR